MWATGHGQLVVKKKRESWREPRLRKEMLFYENECLSLSADQGYDTDEKRTWHFT
jgi:hypothetical protein